MANDVARHHLFEAARTRAGWTVQQLWVGYLALGGTSDAFDIEAFLHGLGPLSDDQQDALANALNERLDDLYRGARVPYLDTRAVGVCRGAPLAVLDELLDVQSRDEERDA
ncbi:MAG TPA: hypothetical protein VFU98_15330 [Microlunatus sp.]|nr:hypothetical protein [Microlunatus sp.]